jgi:hypothetical protein
MLNNKEIVNLQNQIQQLSIKVDKIDKEKEFDYQKVLSAIKYLYRYYDDMNKDKEIEITS